MVLDRQKSSLNKDKLKSLSPGVNKGRKYMDLSNKIKQLNISKENNVSVKLIKQKAMQSMTDLNDRKIRRLSNSVIWDQHKF